MISREVCLSDNTQSSDKPQRLTLNSLQAVRGLAAILVVVDHSIFIWGINYNKPVNINLAVFLGELGVTMFFVISGFVMIYSHAKDFGDKSAIKRFFTRRFNRIIPLYWIMTVLYALYLTVQNRGPSLYQVVLSLLFIPYNAPGSVYGHPVLGQGWTLNYEIMFYIVFGFSLFHRRGVQLVFLVFSLWVIADLCGLLGDRNPFSFWGKPIVLFFLAGVAVGLGRHWAKFQIDFGGALTIAVAFIALAVLTAIWAGPETYVAALASGFSAISTVAICAWAKESDNTNAVRKFAKIIGDITYSTYLTHTLVIAQVTKVIFHIAPESSTTLVVLIATPICILVGLIVYRLIERPLLRTLN
jgi:exopolysaccharide production protein ExoZ